MNPKDPGSLDPKLRETYERVMGTSFTPQQPPSSQPPAEPEAPLPTPQPQPETPLPAPEPEPQAEPQPDPISIPDTPPEMVPSPMTSDPTPSNSSKLKPIFLTLGGIIFFAVYAFIWAKVFGVF